ncbi:MAG: envelope stress response membrane protein PspC [Erythrobacter sp.]|uniref:envelope stress response membrane protein PspC n=1 Tax=Erythrobacter sp. TaxID=1042 RepID=UPI0026124C79|nr:envelope stress response membrane protein PspC [Erythrobacter sp.]MDJ0978635.1 envelope stress response membrane protein PspC [Erythrobacter sp.]
MNSPRTKLYRDKHNGKIMGVCSGIAEYTGIDTIWIRLAAVASIFMTSGSSILFYFLLGLVLNKKPPHLYRDTAEEKYWQRVRQSPQRTAREIRANFRDIDRRLASVEAHYVSSNPRLTAEIERLR